MSKIEIPLLPDGVGKTYVEIGGVKWATMNIGANSETDYGLYFAWGDTQGYTASRCGVGDYQKPFHYIDYKFGNGTMPSLGSEANAMTKYNSVDGKTTLDLSDDAARLNWGGNWRMPTADEFYALSEAVNVSWVTNYNGSGINGRLVTDRTDSSKKLFFPAAGDCFNGNAGYMGNDGIYWSSSLYSSDARSAYCLYFQSSSISWQYYFLRPTGCSVRPVLDE